MCAPTTAAAGSAARAPCAPEPISTSSARHADIPVTAAGVSFSARSYAHTVPASGARTFSARGAVRRDREPGGGGGQAARQPEREAGRDAARRDRAGRPLDRVDLAVGVVVEGHPREVQARRRGGEPGRARDVAHLAGRGGPDEHVAGDGEDGGQADELGDRARRRRLHAAISWRAQRSSIAN